MATNARMLAEAKAQYRWLCEVVPDLSAPALAGVCRNCSLPYTWEEWLMSRSYRQTVACAACGALIYRFLNYAPLASALLERAQALQAPQQRWYHASAQATWPSTVKAKPELLLHGGSVYAARARADALREEDGVATVFLHSFTLRSELRFGAFILEDALASWQQELSTPKKMRLCSIAENRAHSGWRTLSPTAEQAALYYNRFESPGDLSVLFPASAIVEESIATEVLTA